jgi:dynein heavy chain
LNNPQYKPEVIKKASSAAEGITKWVCAICKYDVIAKEIAPKRKALNEATEELNIVSK